MARLAAPGRTAKAGKAAQGRKAPSRARRGASRPAVPFGQPLQAKLAIGPATGRFESEADRAAGHVVANRPGLPALSPVTAPAAQRECEGCEAEEQEITPDMVQRKCAACGREETLQRKCDCDSKSDEPCGCHEDESKGLHIARKPLGSAPAGTSALDRVARVIRRPGEPLDPATRERMEQRFGRSFGDVRVHRDSDAAASAVAVAARAYTVGDHVVFARGQYRPGTQSGDFLIAHELAHTVQQAGGQGALPTNAPISAPGDRHETEAGAAARSVMGGQAATPPLSPAPAQVSRYSWAEFKNDVSGTAGVVVDELGNLAGEAADTARAAWDGATALARAVGSAVSYSGGKLTVALPSVDPCPAIDFQSSLSEFGLAPEIFVPFDFGTLPISKTVSVYGASGAIYRFDPELGIKLGPCRLGPTTVTIDPLSFRTTISSGFAITGGLSFGAQIDLGERNEVGLQIDLASPPVSLLIPFAGLEVGGTAQGRIMGGGSLSHDFTIVLQSFPGSLASITIPTAEDLRIDLAIAEDLAVGHYAQLDVLGQTLCRLNWPSFEWHDDLRGSLALNYDLMAGRAGISAAFSASWGSIPGSPFTMLPTAFDRSLLAEHCDICGGLAGLGLLPSQTGAGWSGHPLGRMPGPLDVFPKTSPFYCYGACGPGCMPPACTFPRERRECVPEGNSHVWYVYHGYVECGSNEICRFLDACHAWSAGGGGGLTSIIVGSLIDLCAIECACRYGYPACLGASLGLGPYDRTFAFADAVTREPGCRGPCPEEKEIEGEEGPETVLQTCLPPINLLDARSFGPATWRESYGPVNLWRQFFEVPYILGVWVGVDARGDAAAQAHADLGPVMLKNACLIYDPVTHEYRGTARVEAQARGGGEIALTGWVDAWGSDFLCLFEVVTISGGLHGCASANLPLTMGLNVDVVCRDGDLWIDSSFDLEACLRLAFCLDALLNVDIFGFRLIEERWQLAKTEWEDCWRMVFEFDPLRVGEAPSIEFDPQRLLQIFDLIQWVFGEAADTRTGHSLGPDPARRRGVLNPCGSDDDDDDDGPETPTCTEVVENPLTSETAHSIASLQPRLNDFNWGNEIFSLPTGGEETVGVEMEANFITSRHPAGSSSISNRQKDIYWFNKLPTVKAQMVGRSTAGIAKDTHYVKGHLLNAELGGPADEENLYPITSKANNPDHLNQVEKGIKDAVNTGDDGTSVVHYYKVEVVGRESPQRIDVNDDGSCFYYKSNSRFRCSWATYRLCNDNIVEKNPGPSPKTISSTFNTTAFVTSVRAKGCPEAP